MVDGYLIFMLRVCKIPSSECNGDAMMPLRITLFRRHASTISSTLAVRPYCTSLTINITHNSSSNNNTTHQKKTQTSITSWHNFTNTASISTRKYALSVDANQR